MTVDSVSTGAPGSMAAVENVGTPQAARLRFTIPRGADGTAATFTTVTVEMLAPDQQPSATVTGSAPNYTLALKLPRGATGAPSTVPGPPGPESWAAPVPWSATSSYTATAPRSIVTTGGSTYAALKDSTGITPGTDTSAWQLLAQKGDQGTASPGADALTILGAMT
jgi:hypothetical protein